MANKFRYLCLVLFAAAPVFAAVAPGTISGYIRSSAGAPQSSAVVEVFTSAAKLGVTVYTDLKGYYSAQNLPAGTYYVKASVPSFLPSLQENVNVRPGANVLVNLTLNTLADALKLIPHRRPAEADPDEWHWTLRSSANRPVLRFDDDGPVMVMAKSPEEAEDHALRGRVAFIAGSQGDGFGSAGEMTTSFALEKSLFDSGTLSLNGNLDNSPDRPNGVLRASYIHDFGSASRPAFTLTYRRLASPGAAAQNAAYSAVSLSTSDRMSIADLVEFNYGADLEAVDFSRRVTAIRPFGSMDVHLTPDTIVEYRYATAGPDPRTEKGFDSAPADLTESGPRMSLASGVPEIERARHQEISLSRRFGSANVQFAYFVDQISNLVLTGAGDPSGYSDNVLPDVYSGTFSYGGGSLRTNGMRLVLQRRINDDLTATLDYSTSGVAALKSPVSAWQDVASSLTTSKRHSMAAKFNGYIPASHTRWITSYKWTSGSALSMVDEFNASAGQTDPYFSVFIRQPLPSRSFIAGRMEALVDIRNLMAQGYVPILGQDGHTVYLVQSARTVRGGLSFTF
ncbi:MAG TPA: carboxypeptidase-like regulatory domain-containing protein [Candidatus Saccharimonadales bacterium]|jgi:hypothetical protein|nr:carboxypeptidase-like regulatory domain-containing protein [Candidatus Saccharimonadales bacterium]